MGQTLLPYLQTKALQYLLTNKKKFQTTRQWKHSPLEEITCKHNEKKNGCKTNKLPLQIFNSTQAYKRDGVRPHEGEK